MVSASAALNMTVEGVPTVQRAAAGTGPPASDGDDGLQAGQIDDEIITTTSGLTGGQTPSEQTATSEGGAVVNAVLATLLACTLVALCLLVVALRSLISGRLAFRKDRSRDPGDGYYDIDVSGAARGSLSGDDAPISLSDVAKRI